MNSYFLAKLALCSDYYPFGAPMPGRTTAGSDYRYGFQGQEQDKEVKNGRDLSVNYKYRVHDPRIGRFFSVDPLTKKYPFYSPYAFSGNRVIDAIELEGLEPWKVNTDNGESTTVYGPYKNQASAQSSVNTITETNNSGIQSDGFVKSEYVTKNQVTALERGNIEEPIKGIVLHRTASSSTESTINAFKNGRGGVNYGTHFIVGKDGKITQTASLNKYTLHVGKTRNENHPNNKNSIGIEVVGRYNKQSKKWDDVTPKQKVAVAALVNALMYNYCLNIHDLYNHEDISYKTKGEGGTVYDAIVPYVDQIFKNVVPLPAETTPVVTEPLIIQPPNY